jgi:hypothetical protein
MFKLTTNIMEPLRFRPNRNRTNDAWSERIWAIARETFELGDIVSGVTRRRNVIANQAFGWRGPYQDGSLRGNYR